ncbi:MAG: methylenetetrahydrofolate reductase [Lachnospiraceae bacterium]|nr:methylenetetrahydrofolate reductase [NAD(P)H] [Lachnospiraceae bacterium]
MNESPRLIDILKSGKRHLSFEVFPPKTAETWESVDAAARQVAALGPSFLSVTYGAGGGTSRYTVSLAEELSRDYALPVLVHLTCISSTHETVRAMLEELKEKGMHNIMALRGDIPKDREVPGQYRYAADLIHEIRSFDSAFTIGGACYPEGHADAAGLREDIRHLKEKVDAGCDFLTTQMFFENETYFRYLYLLRDAGIDVPILPGIMPITGRSQVERSAALSGAVIPPRLRALADAFGSSPAAMAQAGIAYATEQIVDLFAGGVTHVHVYSMNKPAVAAAILNNLRDLLENEA